MSLIGVGSLPIVFLVMFFIGMVLAMQSAVTLKSFGYVSAVGGLVAASVLREIGPMLTAIVLAGRSGAAITAELGTMRVSEEIDALETMGLNPVQFLIVPRVLGMMIMAPCLTVLGDFVAMFGGYLIGVYSLDIDPVLYWRKSFEVLTIKDICSGVLKSVVFAGLVSNVACYFGFIVDGGAEGVGKSTTQSVVTSIVLIIVSDCLLTALFYFF
jgi:phospholipid/cholesterol/gamma-HCH transport system permease protein